jgi:hypothetical protein
MGKTWMGWRACNLRPQQKCRCATIPRRAVVMKPGGTKALNGFRWQVRLRGAGYQRYPQ